VGIGTYFRCVIFVVTSGGERVPRGMAGLFTRGRWRSVLGASGEEVLRSWSRCFLPVLRYACCVTRAGSDTFITPPPKKGGGDEENRPAVGPEALAVPLLAGSCWPAQQVTLPPPREAGRGRSCRSATEP
jgi:hypothetical protein